MLKFMLLASLPVLLNAEELIDACRDVEGVRHKLNDSYLGPDGCNTCTCLAGGNACTKRYCWPEEEGAARKVNAEANKCVDDKGNLHKDGESYTHVDGCNTCVCRSFGGACTKKFCFKEEVSLRQVCTTGSGEQKELGESWLADDGCNTCRCGVIGPLCTKMYCMSPVNVKDPQYQPKSAQIEMSDETGDSPCTVEGVQKMPGDTWITQDSCNICRCTGKGGKIECTQESCRARFRRLLQKSSGSERAVLSIFLPLLVLAAKLIE